MTDLDPGTPHGPDEAQARHDAKLAELVKTLAELRVLAQEIVAAADRIISATKGEQQT